VDVAAVHSVADNDRLLKYCCSFLGYGYFGDILRDSEENLRWMGPKRYDWAGLKKFLLHRVYKGELRLKVSRDGGDPLDNSVCLNK
jgi:ceramide kinase